MRFDIVSILPEVFSGFLQHGVCGRALQNGAAHAKFWNPRDFAKDKYRTVDGRPFGGGSGMVLLAEPLAAAIDAAKKNNAGEVVYLAPRGELLTDSMARNMAKKGGGIILLCGRYRGVDERIIETRADRCVSAGDYVLSGGEVAAMALMESVLRHRPGILGNADSADDDAFAAGLLDAPVYTRPAVWQNKKTPEILLSGNHAAVREWRRTAAENLTRRCRPDLSAKK